MTGAQGFTSHFKGALGELAYCILFGIPWPARVDTFTGPPDVDPDIEIKTSGFGPHLMARPKDVTEHAGRRFVAMSFDKPERTFRCYGWCWGRELAEAPLRDPGGWGKPVHWLEAHDLHRLPMALRHTTREPKESHA